MTETTEIQSSKTTKVEVVFNRNVKYGKDRYKKGDSLSVTKKAQEELEEAGVIEVGE
ncbi:hypothetical protein [Metabacillus fastidiosus]|uniref:DUF7210 family protein n=1 Tax=Metabacillus fastidiosus TaxID=1458 RepID=UPI000AE79E31|nr:hypothetical protein [Metabacillus fastidiosus]MED4461857.1 hypothetical protein [Metabacillus fastidiosus]